MLSAWTLMPGFAFSKSATRAAGEAVGSSKWYHQRTVTGCWAWGAASGAAASAAAPVSSERRFIGITPGSAFS